MKTLKVEIDDKYAGCITVTCVGDNGCDIFATAGIYDLDKVNKLVVEQSGDIKEIWEDNNENI